MKSIAGIFSLSGAPLLQSLLNVFTNGQKQLTSHHSIFMLQRDCFSSQPCQIVSNEGLAICWDGRLDNRDALITSLSCEKTDSLCDESLVRSAYLRWCTDFLKHLIGDFACALWDSRARRLILARDPIGPRPLFYRRDPHRIVWSSEILPLMKIDDRQVQIDDEYIAGYLSRDLPTDLSPYRHIHAVPPGSFVIVEDGGVVRAERYWTPNLTREIRYRTDAEYEEHFRQLFHESVCTRLRSNGPVWAQLSGGLDSSAIVCMADHIIANGQTTKLRTVSYVYGESTTSDESSYIRVIEEKRGETGLHLSENDYPPLSSVKQYCLLTVPDFLDCFANRHQALRDAMKADGAELLLTGHGGDEMLSSGADPAPKLGNLLWRMKLSGLNREIKAWSNLLKRTYLDLLIQDALLPLAPRRIRTLLTNKTGHRIPPWIDPAFVKQQNLRDRNLGPRDPFRTSAPQQQQISDFLSAASLVSTGGYRDRGIQTSHPYLHLPLVEFLLSIPLEQKLRIGETRSLQRRALRDLVPQSVIERRSKQGPDEAFMRAVNREWKQLQMMFAEPLVASLGYVNARELVWALQRARHGCERYSFALIKTISLEFWLRSLEREGWLVKSKAATAKLATRPKPPSLRKAAESRA